MSLYDMENALRAEGYKLICGVDEAGRGPLAGPVFAAAVILSADFEIDGLNDSKKLTEKRREMLFPIIQQNAVAYGIASASEKEIDELNILRATYLAMNRAIASLDITADLCLIDGNRKEGIRYPAQTVIGGDAKCACIAAASVLAKVSRDRLMYELSEKYPEYGFAKHKGYGTKEHYSALREYGPSPIHRMTFLKKMH